MWWCQLSDHTAKFAPDWTTIVKILAIFVQNTLTEHALYQLSKHNLDRKTATISGVHFYSQ